MASAPAGPGADRQACAALAPSPNGGFQGLHLQTLNQQKRRNSSPDEEQPCVPSESKESGSDPSHSEGVARKHNPGEAPLPEDPADFVEEVHSRIDLIEIWQELLKSEDEKIKQRAVEKLTEMRYKGAQSLSDEPQPIVIDIDSAVARRAAQGANQ